MAYLAKIQYKYNDILQNIRDDLGSDTSYYTKSMVKETLKDFKKTFDQAVKPFQTDVKKAIQFKFLPMLQHVAILLDDIQKDPASVEDDLTYHYQFDQEGDLRKIPHQPIIRQTIEELPRLIRQPQKEDARRPKRMNDYSETIEIPMIQHEASPEADIQNLYDDFVGQINSGLASLDDIKEYPAYLLELYQLIRTQIYAPDRPRVLKKLKEMIAQLDYLVLELTKDPSAQFSLSPIKLTETSKGLYPEQKKTYTQKITKSKKQKLIRLGNEDLPIMQRDVVDFFETIQPSSDYEIGKSKSDVVSKVLKGKQTRISQQKKKSKLVDEMNTIFQDYASQIPAKEREPEPEPEMMAEEQAPMPRKRKIHKYPVEATLRPERKTRKPRAKKEKDPTDISKYSVAELKDFMRERKIKGLTGKKAQLLAIVKAYLEQDDD